MLRPDLRFEIRQLIQMWPDRTTLSAAISDATGTSISVTDPALLSPGALLQIDDEVLRVRSLTSGTSNPITVMRGDRGSIAATHANGAAVTVHKPNDCPDLEINAFIRDGFNWLWPVAWNEVHDTSLVTSETSVTYAIPTFGSPAIPIVEELYDLYIEAAGTPTEDWHRMRVWEIIDGSIRVPQLLSAGKRLKIHGGRRYRPPIDDTTALDLIDGLVPAIKYFAAAQILKRYEQLRPRFTGQSALLEARAGNVPEMMGAGRELMQIAAAVRSQHAKMRPIRMRMVTLRA